MRMHKKAIPVLLTSIFLLLVIGSVATAGFFYYRYRAIAASTDSAKQKANADELKRIIDDVAKLMVVPTDETPTMATVTDKEKLREQPFFSNAENGDKVLFYTKAGKAILYRPSLKKVVDFTAIKAVEPSSTPKSEETTNKTTSTITILNSTTISGLASAYEKKIASLNPDITVVAKGQARSQYENSLVFDLTGKNKGIVDSIAKAYGATVSTELPTSEKRPESEILLILGVNAR